MKKLFLLIIASWATSCLPATGPPNLSAEAQTKLLWKLDETIRKNQLNKSYIGGTLSGMLGLTVPVCGAAFTSLAVGGIPFVALGLGVVAVCSFVQDRYITSDNNKNKTTAKERAFEHAKGIGSVAFFAGLTGYAGIKLAKKEFGTTSDTPPFDGGARRDSPKPPDVSTHAPGAPGAPGAPASSPGEK